MLSVSAKSYYRHLWELFFFIVLFSFMPKILQLINGRELSEFIIKLSILGGIVFCTPAMFLFLRYLVLNKSVVLKYQKDGIHVGREEKSRKISLSEVERVETNVTLPVYYNGYRFFATDSYFYAVIRLKNGESFVVTSLIDNELVETVSFFENNSYVHIEKKWSVICWPPGHQFKLSCKPKSEITH